MLLLPLAAAVLAALSDLRTREIPDWICLGVIVSGLASAGFGLLAVTVGSSLVAGLFALGTSLVLALRGGFGGGDVKLLASLATWLGMQGCIAMLFWTAIAGTGFSLIAAVRSEKDLAYAPAITVGFGLAAFTPGLLPAIIAWVRSCIGVA